MLLTIDEYLEYIEKTNEKLRKGTRLLRKYYDEYDPERLVREGKRAMRLSSGLYLSYRDLLLSLDMDVPNLPGLERLFDDERKKMNISVEQLKGFDFPVYKISLPLLLPNKRRQCTDYKNALTEAVNTAVRSFSIDNDIRPFRYATMIILSYGGSPILMVDNDNKEASVIQNGMISFFICDDTPAACNNAYYFKQVDDHKEYRTEIYVVDSAHDIEVLQFIKSIIGVTKN